MATFSKTGSAAFGLTASGTAFVLPTPTQTLPFTIESAEPGHHIQADHHDLVALSTEWGLIGGALLVGAVMATRRQFHFYR